LSRRERSRIRREKGHEDGGFKIDNRWVDADKAAERVKFLENLKLSSFKPLEQMVNRVDCPKCAKSCKYYCCNCMISVVEPTPRLDLPVAVTVIAHPKEKVSKSSIIPAKILAPAVEIH
jgi:hypothetical protein